MKQSENINELAAALCKAQEVRPKAKICLLYTSDAADE